jgi:hypothetical protein
LSGHGTSRDPASSTATLRKPEKTLTHSTPLEHVVVVVVVVGVEGTVVVLGSVGARLVVVTLVVVREVVVMVEPQLTRTTQPESEAVLKHGSKRKQGTPSVEPASVVQLRYSKHSRFEPEQNTLRNEFCVSVT